MNEKPTAEAASGLNNGLGAVTYRVKSGGMNTTMDAGLDATPMEVAMLAVNQANPKGLGSLIEVCGGHYVGSNVTYVYSETVCKKLGRWEESA